MPAHSPQPPLQGLLVIDRSADGAQPDYPCQLLQVGRAVINPIQILSNSSFAVANADDEIATELCAQAAEEARNRFHIGEPSCGLHAGVRQVQVEPQIPAKRVVLGPSAARLVVQLPVDDPCFASDPSVSHRQMLAV